MQRDNIQYYRPENDSRLLNVTAELRRLRKLIYDLEWGRKDASHLYRKFHLLRQLQKEGTEFIPKF